jgi:hypothetical protein
VSELTFLLGRHALLGKHAWRAAIAVTAAGTLAAVLATTGDGPARAAAAARATAAAPAASTPGWRITQLLANTVIGGISAVGARDAWIAGDACANSQCDKASVVVRHWDGTAWRVVTAPKAVTGITTEQGVGAVAASSATNAWVFDGRGAESVDYTTALHWTGQGWAAPVRLNAAIQAAVAPSASEAWAFGLPETTSQVGYVAHYTNGTWTHGSFPVSVTAVSALSPKDVWAGGATSSGFAVAHWNGSKWRQLPLPICAGGTGTTFADFTGVTELGPRNVWAVLTVIGAGGMTPGTFLEHWDGSRWKDVHFPYAAGASATTGSAADGHGGIWLTIADNLGGARSSFWFAHYSNGHWTRTPEPRHSGQQPLLDYLARIPGTRSLWATGDLTTSDSGVMVKYGA